MELYIPKERPNRDPKTGRFHKGLIPHNKGRKAIEYMTPEGLANSLRIGRKNLKPNRKLGGHNRRAVIAITDDERVVGWFPSAEEAARKIGVNASAIRRVCYGKRKHAAGFKWQYD
jgi:hypothetical protein